MSEPTRVAHVFPYDPRHLGQSFDRWAAGQLERWPLAAVARSRLAGRSTVHVVGPADRRLRAGTLEVVAHRSLASGPAWRDWGDDWSRGLGQALRRLGPADACVVHLNDYAAGRLAQRAAWRSRVVIVLHGRGLGRFDGHLAGADRLVVLRAQAADQLVSWGVPPQRVALFVPSVDRGRFHPPPPASPADGPAVLGFVGRLERAKGVLELPAVVRRLVDAGIDARVELVGGASDGQRAELDAALRAAGVADRVATLGELPGEAVAARMRAWRVLLVPSYTEGAPIVVLEARALGLPVAAVSGVLPAEFERRRGIATAARERYAGLVVRLLRRPPSRAAAGWVPDHDQAAAAWDGLLRDLPAWSDRQRLPVDHWGRVRRLRPLRRVARALLRPLGGRRPGWRRPPAAS